MQLYWISLKLSIYIYKSRNCKKVLFLAGLTLPSESESHQFTQNDTDSSGNSPATKRRKFRPVNGTQPHPMAPSSNHVAPNFDAPYYLPAVNHGQGGVEEEEPGVHYMTEDYKMMSPPIRSEETTASLPDSGHGTTSVASTGRSQMSLKEKIAEIGKSLQVGFWTGAHPFCF